MARRQRTLLALKRELLVARADFQREALRAQLRTVFQPSKALLGLFAKWRTLRTPLFAVVAPALALFVARRSSLQRLTKWALPLWLVARRAYTLLWRR